MPSPLSRHIAAARREAAEALAELTASLTLADVTLPSTGIDRHSPFTGTVLVELGAARPDMVKRLAAVVRAGVERVQD
ncbi:hypothetical protein ACIGXM_10790 [Kitasatospora sp. NPDC052896]|uniref:hypothetical protein n=1 Tax=Kitasatospora sp. NPDC052896 TaxID=3364061 RepID=UPI0037CC810A